MYNTPTKVNRQLSRTGQLIITSIVVVIIGFWAVPKVNPVTRLKKLFLSESNFYLDLGDQSLDAADFQKAVVNYTRSIKANEKNAKAWHGRASAYCQMGRFNRCLSDINQAITLSPDNPVLYFERSNIFHNDAKWDETFTDLGKALDLKPDYFDALVARAVSFSQTGKLEDSIRDFTAALDAVPHGIEKKDLATVYAERGLVYYWNQQPDKAIADFHKTLDIFPAAKRSFLPQLAILKQELESLGPEKEVMKDELARLIARIEGSE